MAKKPETIRCPYCHKSISIDEALIHPIEEKIRKNLLVETNKKENELSSKLEKAENEVAKKDEQVKKAESEAKEKYETALKSDKEKLEKEAKKKALEEFGTDFKDLKEQLKEKDKKIVKAQKEELKSRKERRELEDGKKELKLKMQRELDEGRGKIREEAIKELDDEYKLKDSDKTKLIDDLKKKITGLKNTAEQGSQQSQGEVLEQEIEHTLKENFADDEIIPIKTGARGADILQKVCLKTGKVCGTILIESKRARTWSNNWITKLKKDQREANADIGVIVSTVLPDGVNNSSYLEGVYITPLRDAVPTTTILREQIFELSKERNINTGRTEKRESLYNYLTGKEFRHKLESTVEALADMRDDLEKEQIAIQKIWTKREQQIKLAVVGIAQMYGGMQGIVGSSSLPEIKSLKMPEPSLEHKNTDEDKE